MMKTIFKEQESQFGKEDVLLSCNHYKRIRHLVSHKRWEHYLSSKKKMSTLDVVWLLDETEHDISLHAKTVKAPVFLRLPNYLKLIFTFSCKIALRNSFLLSYLRFMIRCKEQEIGFEKRMSCYNIIGLDILLFMGVRTIFVKVLAS